MCGLCESGEARRGAREKVTCFVEREAGTPDPRRGRAAIVLVDARVLELDQICIHVPRGFLAVVEPGALVRHARALVVRT